MSSLSDLETMWAYILKLGPECLALHEVLELVIKKSADGYPKSTFAEGSPSNEKDDDGTPLPQHSDPTFQAVLERNEGGAGEVQAAKRQLLKAVFQSYKAMESAKGRALKVLKPPEQLPDVPEVVYCRSHGRVGSQEMAYSSNEALDRRCRMHELCVWCLRHLDAEGGLPDRRAVEVHASQGAPAAGRWLARNEATNNRKAGTT